MGMSRRSMGGRVLSSLAMAVLLAGCSAGASPTPAGTGGPSTAPAPTKPSLGAGATLSTAQLGQAYLACSDPYDAQVSTFFAKEDSLGNATQTTLAGWQSLYGEWAGADATMVTCLRGIAWTPSLQPEVQALVTALSTDEALDRQAASATTPSQLLGYDSQFSTNATGWQAAVARIRGDLGLPPEPTPVISPESTTGPTIFNIGDAVPLVALDGSDQAIITITDVKVVANYGPSSSDKPLSVGDVFISAKVTYAAQADDVTYNPSDWLVFCDGVTVSTTTSLPDGPTPKLQAGTLSNGASASGYVVYEVPAKGEVLMGYVASVFGPGSPIFEVTIRAS